MNRTRMRKKAQLRTGLDEEEWLEQAQLASIRCVVVIGECVDCGVAGEPLRESAVGLSNYVRHLVETIKNGTCRLEVARTAFTDIRAALRMLTSLTLGPPSTTAKLDPGLKMRLEECVRLLRSSADSVEQV